MKKILITVFALLFIANVCISQCNTLPSKFSSYSQAAKAINNTSFTTTDRLPDGKSSWISSANYYSCDGSYGYMIFTTAKGGKYIHEGVPVNVWNSFKNAPSSGSYYDYNIKNRYRLVPGY